MSIVFNVLSSAWHAVLFLIIVLLPCVLFITLLQCSTDYLRKRIVSVMSINFFIYSTAPGVVIHECGHLVFCLLFLHDVRHVSFFSPSEDGTLGYVSYQYNPQNIYQRIGLFFTGTGPIWFGLLVLFFLSKLLLPGTVFEPGLSDWGMVRELFNCIFSISFWCSFKHWIWFYLSLSIALHINLSAPDIASAWQGLITIILTVFILFILLGWIAPFRQFVSEMVFNYVRWMSPVFFIIIMVSAISFLIGTICSFLGDA